MKGAFGHASLTMDAGTSWSIEKEKGKKEMHGHAIGQSFHLCEKICVSYLLNFLC